MNMINATLMHLFGELNWKSFLLHVIGLFLLFGTPELRPQVEQIFGQYASGVIAASEIVGVILNIWGRSPAITPLGTIKPETNVP